MVRLSVVIPSLNSEETIHYTLKSLLTNDLQRERYEVIVADGGSTDQTLERVTKFPVRIVRCEKTGIGVQRNIGIVKAKYDVVCFVDSDCKVPRNYLRKISDYFDLHPEVDGIGGPVLPWIYDGVNDWSRFIEEIFFEACDFPAEETSIGPREEVWTHTLKGANFAFRKAALIFVGGFEETMRGEDIEICWRLVENGKELRFVPGLKVFHHIAGDLYGIFNHSFRWGGDCMALRRKYPENPMTLFSETKNAKKERTSGKGLRKIMIHNEPIMAMVSIVSIVRSIVSFRPLYNNRKKAFLRAFMLAAFYLGYFHAPKRLLGSGNLGSFADLNKEE